MRQRTLVICTKAPIPGFVKTRLGADAHRLHGLSESAAMRNAAIVYGEMLDRVLSDTRPEPRESYDVEVHVLYPSNCTPEQAGRLEQRIRTLVPEAAVWRQPASSSPVGVRVRMLSLLMQRLPRQQIVLTAGSCVGFDRAVCGDLFAMLDPLGAVFLRSDSEGHAGFAVDMAHARLTRGAFTLLHAATRLFTDSAVPGPVSLADIERRSRRTAMRLMPRFATRSSELQLTNFLYGAGRALGVRMRSVHGVAGATIRDIDYLEDLRAVMPEAIAGLLGERKPNAFWARYVDGFE